MIGGRNESGYLSSVESYNLETNEWNYVSSLPQPLAAHAGAVHNGKIYISGQKGSRRSLGGGLTKPDEAARRQRRWMRRILSLFITARRSEQRALIQRKAQTLTLIQIKAATSTTADKQDSELDFCELNRTEPTRWQNTDTQIKAVIPP